MWGQGSAPNPIVVPPSSGAADKQGDLTADWEQPPGAPLQGPSPALRKLAQSCRNRAQ